MTRAQLASRLGVSLSMTTSLEASEARRTITLASLQRMADALDCELVYALVPKRGATLEEMIRERGERMVKPGGHERLREHLVLSLASGGRRHLWR